MCAAWLAAGAGWARTAARKAIDGFRQKVIPLPGAMLRSGYSGHFTAKALPEDGEPEG